MLLGLPLWGRAGVHCLGCWNNLCGNGAAAHRPRPRQEQGLVCHYRRPDKKSIPFQVLCTKPGLQELLWAGGVHTSLPRVGLQQFYPHPGREKTAGAAPVSLMNAASPGGSLQERCSRRQLAIWGLVSGSLGEGIR